MQNEKIVEKILTIDQADTLSSLTGKKVLVGGCFDILHYGHITFLNNARHEGDLLIVMLESDEFIKKYKQRDPAHNQDQRATILAHMSVVDYVVKLPLMNGNDDYLNLVKKIQPTVIAITDKDEKFDLKKQHADQINAKVKVVTELLPFSSSKYATISRN